MTTEVTAMTNSRIIRKPKGTAWENARHVMFGGLFLFFALLAIFPNVRSLVESIRMPDTPITAEFDLHPTPAGYVVDYRPDPAWPVRANFIIQTRDINGHVLCTYPSQDEWPYSSRSATRGWWPWAQWVEDGCPVPDHRFFVCLRYRGFGQFGTPFDTPYQCRGPYLGGSGAFSHRM